jgi:hypothetical protein
VHAKAVVAGTGGRVLLHYQQRSAGQPPLVLPGRRRNGIDSFGATLAGGSTTFTPLGRGMLPADDAARLAARARENHAVAAAMPSALTPAVASAPKRGDGLGPPGVALAVGTLSLPLPPDYRPDWARLTDVVFLSPRLRLLADGSVDGLAADTSIGAPAIVAAAAPAAVAQLVAEAHLNGVRCHLALRCHDAFAFKAAAGKQAGRLKLAANILDAVATSAMLLPEASPAAPQAAPIQWDGLQLDVQQFHEAEGGAYQALVRQLRSGLRTSLALSLTLPPEPEEGLAAKYGLGSLAPFADFFVLQVPRASPRRIE